MIVISLGEAQILCTSQPIEFIRKEAFNNAYILNQPWERGGDDLLNALESNAFQVGVIHGESSIRLAEIKQSIRCFKAGGGLVLNEHGDLLMIFRNGVWDLPKGKWEPNETMAECALREVQEETGIQQIQLGEMIQTTRHFYKDEKGWVLKETDWYKMKAPNQVLVPQTEEGITAASWVSSTDLFKHLLNTYYSIKVVIEAARL